MKFNILTDTETAVLQTMTMQMSRKKALQYLKGVGIDISKRTYFRCKKKVEASKWQRLYRIYRPAFTEDRQTGVDRVVDVEKL